MKLESKLKQNLPIGVIDSGIGGITVLKEIATEMPNESIIYIGDEAHFPYGEKSIEQIKRYSLQICDWLTTQGVKLIVVACNTITGAAINDIRLNVDVPVVGVVDAGVLAICDATKNNKVGILATQATVDLQVYDKKLAEANPNISVTSVGAPALVRAVEQDVDAVINNPSVQLLSDIAKYCQPFKDAGCDTVAMACTHFPPAQPLLAKELGSNVELVSPSKKTAEEVARILKLFDLSSQCPAQYNFYSTGSTTKHLEAFWQSPANFSLLNLKT